VLSGFLITTLLLEEHSRSHRVSLSNFYLRRGRRLLPALVALLGTYLIVRAAKGENGLQVAALAGLYLGNAVQAFSVHDVVSGTCLAHLWSLAEEEQFYLVWPCLLLLALRLRRVVLWLALALVALMAYRAVLALDGASTVRLYYAPDTRADGLLAGAILALWRQRGFAAREPVALVGFAIVFVGLFLDPWARAWEIWQTPILAIGSAALVAAACSGTQMAVLLSARPIVGLGKISYSLYLWHVPVFCALGYRHPVLAVPLSVVVALLSYRYVEQPFRRRRGRAERTQIALVALPVPAALRTPTVAQS
jgi:peptidoglycan/LPS O-acetylase OafA/YrhL